MSQTAKTLDTGSVEDTNLYADTQGKGAKIATPVAQPGTAERNKATIAAKPSDAAAVIQTPDQVVQPVPFREHIEQMFDGEDLSEEFMDRAETIFEAAVSERVSLIEEELKEAVQETFEEELEAFKAELVERVDDYLNYVVEEWVKENEVAIEQGLRTEVAESFIGGLKTLFETNFIDVPAEKVDILEDIVRENEEMTDTLNEAISINIELNKVLAEYRKSELFGQVASDLSDVQIDRFSRMVEGIDFEDDEQFVGKLMTLKESYFGDSVKSSRQDVEEVASPSKFLSENTSSVSRYIEALDRQAEKKRLYEA